MKSRGMNFSTLATSARSATPIFQRYGRVGDALDRRHHRVVALQRQLDRALAEVVGLLDVGLRGDVPRRALQVVGHRPVELVAERVLDHVARPPARRRRAGRGRRRPCVPCSARKRAVGVVRALGDDDRAVAVLLHQRVDPGDELLLVELDLREEDHDRDAVRPRSGRRPRRSSRRAGPSPRARTPWSRCAAIERTSNEASSVDTATYLATEPKPGQQSVIGRSLSTVFGTWIACSG